MPSFDDYFALYDKGAYQEAYDILREIMETQPRWSRVGQLYVWCANLELAVNDDVCKARDLLERARELGCSHMAPYYNTLGYVLWRTGDRDTGIQYLEKSVALHPSVFHLTSLGELLSADDDKRAIWIWRRVLQEDPMNCSAYIRLGEEAAKSGNTGQALLMAKRAEKLNPSVENLFDIGGLYHELGEYEIAVNKYLQANRLGYEPKGPLYASIAASYLSLGEASMARKYAEWALRSNPENDYVKHIWREYEGRFGEPEAQ